MTEKIFTFDNLEEGYKAMAADTMREQEANEWCEGTIGDIPATD